MEKIQEHLGYFHAHLLENGYSESASKNYRFRASTFLKQRPEALDAGESDAREIVEDYISGLPSNTASTIPAAAVRRWWAFRFGKPYRDRIVPSKIEASESIAAELAEFERYLVAHANIKPVTIRNRVAALKLFLCATFPDGDFERRAITLQDVVGYHTSTATGEGPSMRALQGSDLRSYIRFLRWEGVDDIPLDAVSLSGPTRRDHTIPGRLDEGDYEALLASCDTGTERGARDVAMTLCMGNLGLRACDVARLTVDDIAWADGTVTVHDSKSKTARVLPLDERTGSAIESYAVMRGKSASTRALFLNTAGSPIESCQVQTAMSLAAGRAGIEAYHGTHGLRRMVATNMVNAGVDAKTIADVLGHERIDTTMGYMKVSLPNLRKAAAHWPREARS
ncbi:tyrosine-type recombinase/integrase [Curtanaerobium respiraculi]|uniref:tyrosine-type recombinase/integrase n=1 Tax=Curtanaerobium respiraculi TaxID=2949669 RepID=UPI0024B3B667|nr:tyrosine-type recombinase/integrase [Curtanaerobium respiraculi]